MSKTHIHITRSFRASEVKRNHTHIENRKEKMRENHKHPKMELKLAPVGAEQQLRRSL